MEFCSSYNQLQDLYKAHLATIGGIKFTFREADILACIVHNRGEKKIASILLVSPRTVGAHVYNIMNKLGANSKDQIIDFIESSGTLNIIRQYYLHLLIKANFIKQLTYIGTRVNRTSFTCYYYRDDLLGIDETLRLALLEHLKLANIQLVEITTNATQKENLSPIIELNKLSTDNYYYDFLAQVLLLLKITEKKDQILADFEQAYKTIAASSNDQIGTSAIEPMIKADAGLVGYWFSKFNQRSYKLAVILGLLAIFIFLLTREIFWQQPSTELESKNHRQEATITKAPDIIKDLENFLVFTKEHKFSADNSSTAKIQKNHSLVKKIEKILEYNNQQEVQTYLQKAQMSAEVLISYLYNLHALATYYLYNMHDGAKAEQILLYSKDLAEKYINSRGQSDNNFSQLSKEEILAELAIVQDLPQIYTRIIYSLGRSTGIYQGKLEESREYFQLAKYLGDKLDLFEGYLSDISGLLVINSKLAEQALQEGGVEIAYQQLTKIIASYEDLQHNSRIYIKDYEPNASKQQTIIPKDNAYNLVECSIRIIWGYTKVLEISRKQGDIQRYIRQVSKHLAGNTGIKQPILASLLAKVPDKKAANFYNKLGELILALWKLKTIESIELEDNNLLRIIQIAFITTSSVSSDYLKLAEELFTLARNKSRRSDFTKADSYRGLIKVYQLMLNHKLDLPESNIQELKAQINALTAKLRSSPSKISD